MALRPLNEAALRATLAAIPDDRTPVYWTSPDPANEQHPLCLELERRGLIYRRAETAFGLVAWCAHDLKRRDPS